jgi:hypothetical protein
MEALWGKMYIWLCLLSDLVVVWLQGANLVLGFAMLASRNFKRTDKLL